MMLDTRAGLHCNISIVCIGLGALPFKRLQEKEDDEEQEEAAQ